EGVVLMLKVTEHYRPASHFGKGLRRAVKRSRMECFSVVKEQMPELGLAQPNGALEHRIENGFKVAGRRTDDAQHLRCRGLLLQRFAQLVRPLLLRLE